MAVGRQADDRAVAEHVVLAVDQAQFVAEVEIARVEAAPGGDVGVHPGLPFAALHQHRRVRDQRVAADMVEMEMRVDDQVDLRRVAADRFEPGADFLAGLEVEAEQAGEARPEPAGGVVLAIGVHARCRTAPLPFGCSIR